MSILKNYLLFVKNQVTPKTLVWLWIIGFVLAAIGQGLFQANVAAGSLWGRNLGWQTEIAIWNIGMILVLLGVLKSNKSVEKNVILGLTVLCTLFGVNHLTAAIKSPLSYVNWGGFLGNLFYVQLAILFFIQFRDDQS